MNMTDPASNSDSASYWQYQTAQVIRMAMHNVILALAQLNGQPAYKIRKIPPCKLAMVDATTHSLQRAFVVSSGAEESQKFRLDIATVLPLKFCRQIHQPFFDAALSQTREDMKDSKRFFHSSVVIGHD
jgi:hypothetical protein